MKRLLDLSIRTKLVVLVMATCMIALLVTSALYIEYDRASFRTNTVERVGVLAQVAASGSIAALVFNSVTDANETLATLNAEPQILLAEITRPDGTHFAEYACHDCDTPPGRMDRPHDRFVFDGGYLHLWQDVVIDRDTLGELYMVVSMSELDERLASIVRMVVYFILIALALAFVLTALSQRMISLPIRSLADAARRVSTDEDYTIRVPERGGDEVGFLIHQFNHMLGRVQSSNEALQKAHDTLDRRVKERTEELESEVAERRQTELELRESEARLRTEQEDRRILAVAIEQSPEAVIVAEANGIVRYVNRAFEQVFGIERDAILSGNVLQLKSDLLDEQYYESMWLSVSQGDVWNGLFRRTGNEQCIQHLDVTIAPIRDASGSVANFVSICRDVTQELEMEHQFRHSQKLESVGSLAAGIAHEINTPIQFVGDNLEFVGQSFDELLGLLTTTVDLATELEGAGESPALGRFRDRVKNADLEFLQDEVPRAIEQSKDGVRRVSSIVQAMKRFSHPDDGQNKAAANLNDAISSTLVVAGNELKYVANVVTEFQEDLPMVMCHLSDLNQVVLNMLINAAHAIADTIDEESGALGTITVRTHQDGPDAVIEIADTGAGIPAEVQSRIFDPFFTTKAVGRGTGQGLAIARSIIVEKHNGQLTFTSTPGEGTRFAIRLPIQECKPEEEAVLTEVQ